MHDLQNTVNLLRFQDSNNFLMSLYISIQFFCNVLLYRVIYEHQKTRGSIFRCLETVNPTSIIKINIYFCKNIQVSFGVFLRAHKNLMTAQCSKVPIYVNVFDFFLALSSIFRMIRR